MASAALAIDWTRLAADLRGAVILAGDERMVLAGKQYGAGMQPPMPHALIRCADADDVRRTLVFLRAHGVAFAVRSGGHCFGDLSSSSEAVIDLAELNAIRIEGDRVHVGPGALAADVSRALSAIGRVLPTGGCPWVAVGGLALVGGFGFLGRAHGLLADQILAIDMVSADAELLRIDASHHADLHWALRGAGAAGFGIVTALTLATHPLPPLLVCHGRWPLSAAAALIERWQDFAPDAPDTVNLELGLTAPGDDEEPCSIELFGVLQGSAAAGHTDVDALRRALGEAAAEVRFHPLAGTQAADYLVGLLDRGAGEAWQPSRPYRTPGYQFTHSQFFDDRLSRAAIEACVQAFAEDRCYNEHRELELIPWRGAYARGGGAFAQRGARMLIRHTAVHGHRSDALLRAHGAAWVAASRDALAAHANGGVYAGYAERALAGWAEAYYGSAHPRLREIKRRYDPDEVFRHPQSIAPAQARC